MLDVSMLVEISRSYLRLPGPYTQLIIAGNASIVQRMHMYEPTLVNFWLISITLANRSNEASRTILSINRNENLEKNLFKASSKLQAELSASWDTIKSRLRRTRVITISNLGRTIHNEKEHICERVAWGLRRIMARTRQKRQDNRTMEPLNEGTCSVGLESKMTPQTQINEVE